ncbi:hypothetical protein C2S53_003788 [Perilla frutescens var. hirtella]|uniref:Uncharacterized protein n=1 Tax=Perilla frutescens var. hirtella TaxID=608512 RepID=A0AAD4JK90_PERFH|nr:hypothetical protein C2S53_003788 [Perilla frutescens var. hirtella]
MDLDFDKYCLVDGSPTTVLPAPRHRLCVASRKSSGKLKYGNDTPSLTEEFGIDFGGSCRDVRSQRFSREGTEVLKRESVYQSSKEVRLIQKTDAVVGRKKIEFPPGNASAFSLGIIDSLCSSDEESSLFEQYRASIMSLSEQSTTSAYGNEIEFCYDVSAISLESVTAAIKEANSPQEKDPDVSLQKSLSARFAFPHSPAKSECDSSRASSPQARFSPVKKMLDPFLKSKSRRSPLSNFNETHGETISGLAGISSNKAVCRSLLEDILEKPHHVEHNNQCEEKENHNSVPQCSPAHLHGLLKLGNKQGVPFFQFSVKSLEDVYVAKTWKVENASSWVYTFHSLPHRRKRSTSGWGFKECNRESSMIGRMHVSCHLHTEFKGAGQSNDSMVTEFVLYDILHSRKSTASQGNTSCSGDIAKLHPELESAAIIVQVPLEKRESLKFKSGDKNMDETPPNLLDICRLGTAKEGISDTSSPGKMHVVIPAGNHSSPISEGRGPSPLLDRWRFGGGCDCGGWDMACPLNIFTNKFAEGQPLIDNQNRAELFAQGRKDNVPALSMRVMEDGKYAVDFHAQLSSLQAFSISVAILHAAKASRVGQERRKQTLQSDSLRVYTEEEIRTMLDAIAEEEKSKANKMEELMPSFVVNPPFSPVARV